MARDVVADRPCLLRLGPERMLLPRIARQADEAAAAADHAFPCNGVAAHMELAQRLQHGVAIVLPAPQRRDDIDGAAALFEAGGDRDGARGVRPELTDSA